MSEKEASQEPWTLFTDGSSCIDGSCAEYEALLAGLRITAQIGVRNIRVSVDSKLVINQVLGTYIAKEENMIKYLEKEKSLVIGFASFSISQVPRSHNKKADALSKIASTSFAHFSKQVLQEKSIQEQEVAAVVEEEGPTWITPITEYLKDGVLPNDKKEANKLCIKARQYELMDGILYRRSFLRLWLRLNLDLLEERRERAIIREAKAKSKMMRYYNARVRGVTFNLGDYVYRSNEASHAIDGGKLGPKWEGTLTSDHGSTRRRSITI
ncbi:reverse transcriptase domain-containing protein [Tanacetum coccineum]